MYKQISERFEISNDGLKKMDSELRIVAAPDFKAGKRCRSIRSLFFLDDSGRPWSVAVALQIERAALCNLTRRLLWKSSTGAWIEDVFSLVDQE